MQDMQVLLPPGWPRPKGYSNGVAANGRMVFIAGMIGWDEHGNFRKRRLRGPGAPGAAEHRGGPEGVGRQARAHRAHDVVRHRQARVPRGRQGSRRRLSRDHRLVQCGHDRGAGDRADRGPGQGRDRGDGGDPSLSACKRTAEAAGSGPLAPMKRSFLEEALHHPCARGDARRLRSQQLSGDCSNQMEDLRDEFGPPQDIEASTLAHINAIPTGTGGMALPGPSPGTEGTGSCETVDQNFPPSEQRPATNPSTGGVRTCAERTCLRLGIEGRADWLASRSARSQLPAPDRRLEGLARLAEQCLPHACSASGVQVRALERVLHLYVRPRTGPFERGGALRLEHKPHRHEGHNGEKGHCMNRAR